MLAATRRDNPVCTNAEYAVQSTPSAKLIDTGLVSRLEALLVAKSLRMDQVYTLIKLHELLVEDGGDGVFATELVRMIQSEEGS